MPAKTIVHLVDDTTAGGVTRVIDFMLASPEMAGLGRHRVVVVPRGRFSAPALDDDIIVSHLSVSWRNLPQLVALRARYADRTLIHVEHSYTAAFTGLKVRHRPRFFALLRTAYSLFDRLVAVSEAQGRWLSERGLVRREALAVIPSCVDLAPFLRMPPRYGTPRVIGAIGRFDEQKGFDILIRAFRETRNPDIRLHLIGDGADRVALEALAAGDDRISFQSFSPDPASVMSKLDLIAMPSRWEAYGLVALEARAAGRPLLVSRVDGLEDHVAAGARAVSSNTVESWREAIARAVEAGPALHIGTARAREEAQRRQRETPRLWNALIDGARGATSRDAA
ncbi:glycosyltransferase [Tropicimonas isoalkanivorans]|uniref:Glycosyltransferase involved in cell wall bisynthesis n=1 Tax=Tropicimonas isoalkanivorans TaxID=441112 RepID=A0A1I1GDH5_9RHOB|nr:glycosyltransferase [Tropicimonas isoalkanivorans]SFC09516.1 Glycosyltransferase involved in cell wall bisynthesis [Tropicimonas isoalkanivorans]